VGGAQFANQDIDLGYQESGQQNLLSVM